MRFLRVLLVLVAVGCFGIALSYPIRYRMAQESNNSELEALSAMRARAREQLLADAPQAGGESGPAAALTWNGTVAAGEPGTAAGAQAGDPAYIPQGGTAAAGEPGTAAGAQAGDPASIPQGGTAAGTEPGTAAGAQAGDPAYNPQGGTAAGAEAGTAAGTQAGDPASIPQGGTAAGAEPGTAAGAQEAGAAQAGPALGEGGIAIPEPTPRPTATPRPSPTPGMIDLVDEMWLFAQLPPRLAPTATPRPTGPTAEPSATPVPLPTVDRSARTGPAPYPYKEKVLLDEAKILPELKEIYALNHDLVGWISIPDTQVDYPVVQTEDSEFYLEHDFYGEKNVNGQIILDTLCDPYTPSYNLVISGHHMKNGSMFGGLTRYASKSYWESHRFVEFDTLMSRKQYVVFAAFYSADYDEDEEGFRYNADIQFRLEADLWLQEIHENKIYDTGIDAGFGDEFITLTTCTKARRRDGRFVLVCRAIREGEEFE